MNLKNDIISKQNRSYNMSRIKANDTKPELIVRKVLLKNGYRYRLHSKKVVGKPDIIFEKRKKIIFVHGCFWHRHENCKYSTFPKTNKAFWNKKFDDNIKRDETVKKQLLEMGYKVMIIWECQTKDMCSLEAKILEFVDPLKLMEKN